MSEELGVADLARAALTEQLSPELLPWSDKVGLLVENFKELLSHQEQEVANVGMMYSDPKLAASMIQMDIDRTKYQLSSLLRRRLLKIQNHYKYVEAEWSDRLSVHERAFLNEYARIKEHHYVQSFLGQLPRGVKGLKTTDDTGVPTPDLNKYVCVRALKPVMPIDVGGQTADMKEGEIWMLPYSRVSQFVKEGKVELI